MKKQNDNRRIKIKIVLPILIIGIIIFVVINFFVIPPKVSPNAEKYRFNPVNIIGLESITIDNDRMIYEFSSLNIFFNKLYIKNNQKSNNEGFLEGYYSEINQETENFILTDYKVISTITSNYLIIPLKEGMKISSIRCSYKKIKSGEQFYIIASGTDNPKIHKLRGLSEKIVYEQKSQYFDMNKGKWDKPQKKEFDINIK